MAFVNEKTEDGKRRTIDSDRGAILICIERGQPEKPYVFELQYLGYKVQFYAICKLRQTPANTQQVAWEVTSLIFPNESQQENVEITKILQEGLTEYGLTGRRDHIESVTVSFPNFVV